MSKKISDKEWREQFDRSMVIQRSRNPQVLTEVIKEIKKTTGLRSEDISGICRMVLPIFLEVEKGKHSPPLVHRERIFDLHNRVMQHSLSSLTQEIKG